MCTLIAIHRRVPGAPLIVAANRDEYLDRPAEGPALRDTPSGPVLAPLDLRAGGTWLGLNADGVFAAVTNRPCGDPDRTLRSRGLVVMDALAAGSAEQASQLLADLPSGSYNPFNCFVADRDRAFAMVYQDGPQVSEMAPGAHMIGNADPDARDVPKTARILEQAEKAALLPRSKVLDELASICSDHGIGNGSIEDACVHRGAYGTRCSILLQLDEAGSPGTTANGESRLLYADGAPCTAPYEDFTSLLLELTRRATTRVGGIAPRNAS